MPDRQAPRPAPHVQAAIRSSLQPKGSPLPPRPLAPHVQRAVGAGPQPKLAPSAQRTLAPHVMAVLGAPRSTAAPPATGFLRGPNRQPGSIQPCGRFWRWLTSCGRGQADVELEEGPLMNVESGSSVPSVSSRAVSRPTMVSLEQGSDDLITYGGHVINTSTTTCGLVILHTEGAQAVGYHWPFCRQCTEYEGAFEHAIGSREGTSIEVVVNGGRYRSGDTAPKDFGLYLRERYRLPVTVYRQVVNGTGRNDPDPWVVVERGGVRTPVDGYQLIAVPL